MHQRFLLSGRLLFDFLVDVFCDFFVFKGLLHCQPISTLISQPVPPLVCHRVAHHFSTADFVQYEIGEEEEEILLLKILVSICETFSIVSYKLKTHM